MSVAVVTVLSYDYKTKRSVTVSVPTKYPLGGKHAQAVESFDCPGQSRQQQVYQDGAVHDVTSAIGFLRDKLIGFFVAMPLDFGRETEIEGNLSKELTGDIA